MPKSDSSTDSNVVTEERVKVKIPKSFKVVILNDDYTPMDFVVSILEQIFRLSPAEAVKIMLEVHNKGAGVCGVYTKQIAEAKVEQVHSRAQEYGYPLKCNMEEV
jgi:ATP-dependent Clp protease adaptor protein ClpS